MKKLGLIPQLIIAIIVGILIGKTGLDVPVRILATFNSLFGNFLGFIIPLIIIGFVATGIGDLGKGAGKLLGITAGIAYLSTIISGSMAYGIDTLVFPKMLTPGSLNLASTQNPEHALLPTYINIAMPPIIDVMGALLLAFIIGLGITLVKGSAIKNFMAELQQIVENMIKKVIIPLLPLHIAGIFANMTHAGQVATILTVFFKVFLLIIAMQLLILAIQFFAAGIIAGHSPLKLLRNMAPAYLTAIGTQSSAATIPVTLEQTKKNGVNTGIADFVVPLCATIHLSGSTITLTSCSMAVMILNGLPITPGLMFPFILMLGVTMVAAPGVPGGAVMAALGLLQTMLGFNETLLSLMIALYLAQDSFGTACNITGDGAIAIIVNKISGYKLKKPQPISVPEYAEIC